LLEVGKDFDPGAVVSETGAVIDEVPKLRPSLVFRGGGASIKELDRRLAD
jgi:hypothetical protein